MAVPAGQGLAGHRAPDGTRTPGGQSASLWPTRQGPGSDDSDGGGDGDGDGVDDGGGGGGGTRPHHAEVAEAGGGGWIGEKGTDGAHGHQRTTLRTEGGDHEKLRSRRNVCVSFEKLSLSQNAKTFHDSIFSNVYNFAASAFNNEQF